MNLTTYEQTVLFRAKAFDHDKQIAHGLLGMLTELGEWGDLIKRDYVYGKPFDRINLMEEIGDYVWYFVLWLHEMGTPIYVTEAAAVNVQGRIAAGEGDDTLSDQDLLKAVLGATATLCDGDLSETLWRKNEKAQAEIVTGVITLLIAALHKHGFTLAQCLDRNDAKLAERSGCPWFEGAEHHTGFKAKKILERDTDAERKVLEAGSAPTLAETVAKTVAEVEGDKGGVYGGCAA